MKKLAAIFGIAGLGGLSLGTFAYNISMDEQKSRHQAPETQVQSCIHAAVKGVLPDAFGGVIRAEDRLEGYQGFGDMMHFRDRGLREVTSVTVNLESFRTFVRTDTDVIVMPARTGLTTPFHKSVPSHWISDERKSMSDPRHEEVINKVLACKP